MVILVGGSRFLPPSSVLRSVLGAALAAGCTVRVGCATGADEQALRFVLAAQPARLAIFAAFGPSGAGAWRCSAVSAVLAAAAAGVPVSWWAGSGASFPLRARLALRSRAALAGADLALFFNPGPGSLAVAAHAVSAGIPAFAFGPRPAALPGAGSWQPARLWGFPCWRWLPAQVQQSLF